MKKLLPFLLLVAGFAGCKEDDLGSQTPIFTFYLSPEFTWLDGGENWIVLRDNETGRLLDVKRVIAGDTVEFRTSTPPSGNKIAVSFLQYGPTPIETVSCHVDVYNGVEVGSVWMRVPRRYSNNNTFDNPVKGYYSLAINNVPSLYGFTVSDGLGGNDHADLKAGTLSGKFFSRTTPLSQFVSIDPDGASKPKYKWIHNVKQNDAVQLDYNQFVDFDKYFTVSFPATKEVIADVKAADGSKWYTTYYNFQWGRAKIETSELHFGLLDEFTDYSISLQVKDFQYRSRGPVPSSINVSESSDFTISAPSFRDFSITTSKSYVYSVSYYSVPLVGGPAGQTTYSISYYSPAGSKHHEPLTPELVSRYNVKLDNMKYSNASIVLSGQTYEDALRSDFDPEYERPTIYELMWFGNSSFPLF